MSEPNYRASAVGGLFTRNSVTSPSVRSESLTIHSAESALRRPWKMVLEMVRDLRESRELAWRLFVRDTSAQYRQSILGYIWAFAPPLVTSLPFIFLNSQGVVSIQKTTLPYAAYAMTGTIIWQVFVDALNSPLKTAVAAKPMLCKINFPPEAMLLSGLGQVAFSFIVRLILLIAVFLWFHITPPGGAALFPFGIAALALVGFTVGVALTPLGLLYNDVQQLIPIMAMFLMFLTPVLYPPPVGGLAGFVATWNPLSPLVLATRDWLTMGTTSHFSAFCTVTGIASAIVFVGWVVFRVSLPHLIARMGN